jgi:1,4-dihydroxy-2-naphthoate octaprenyltransferase
MELKVDNTTKILLGAIALGLFLNASNIYIDKAHANDWDVVVELNKSNVKIDRMQENLNIIDKNVRVIEKIIDEAKEDIINEINKKS